MSDRHKTAEDTHEEQLVLDFLTRHPDFFSRHPDILEKLALPHDSGRAVSLVERQVAVLRQRNVELRHRLNELIDNARANDRLFDKSKQLVLRLVDADTLPTLVSVLDASLREDFGIPAAGLLIFDIADSEPLPGIARVVTSVEAQDRVAPLFHGNRPLCGILRPEEVAFLFGADAGEVGSVAAVRLGREQPLGILALGNPDPHHYQSDSGTLFLGHIADVLNRVMPRLL